MRLSVAPLLLALILSTPARGADRDEALWRQAEAARTALLADLEAMVHIDSGTGDKAGVEAMSRLVTEKLEALGAEVKAFPVAEPPGVNPLATVKGTGEGTYLLLAHMDTVFERGTAAARPFRTDGEKAYGPGVVDNKGGIALGLHALGLLKARGYRDFARVTFLLNADEEKGSFGSRDLIQEQSRLHDYVLCLEPGKPPDAVVTWRKGIGYYKVEVRGKAAHAGVDPENGRNAGLELAHQVLQLSKLEKPELGTTVNFTLFRAGERSNVIPDYAFAQADVRVLLPDEFDRLERDFRETSKYRLIPDTEIRILAERGRPPMPKRDEAEQAAAALQRIYETELGLSLGTQGSGGGTDANYAAAAGAIILDGQGPVGDHLHTAEEYLLLSSLAPRLYLLTRALMTLAAQRMP